MTILPPHIQRDARNLATASLSMLAFRFQCEVADILALFDTTSNASNSGAYSPPKADLSTTPKQQPSAPSRPKAAAASTPPVGAQAEEVAAPVSSAEPILPETAKETSPSVEGINAPLVTVAADANTGGLNDVVPRRSATEETLEDRADDQSLGSDVESVAPRSKRITQRQRVRECHEANPDWTSSQIAAHLGMGVQHVRVIAGHISLKLPKDVRQPKASLQDRVIAAYEAHPDFTNRQIADLVGCSYSTVSSWLSARRKAVAAPSAPAAPETPPAVTAAPPIAEPPPAKAPAPVAPPRPAPERDATDELHTIRRPSSSVRFYVRDKAGRYLHQSLERSPTDTGPLMTDNRKWAWFDNAQRFAGASRRWPEIADMRREVPQP